MSWKGDEWKENLPSDALSHINTMEVSLEKLQKDIVQLKFKTESLAHTASNLTEKVNEKNQELKEAEGEICNLQDKLDNELAEQEALNIRLKKKDDEIYRLKKKIETLEGVDKLENEPTETDEKADSNYDQQQTVEHLEMLLQKKNEKQIFYKEKVLTLTKDKEKLEEGERQLQERNVQLEQQIATLNAEKAILERKTCCLENKCYTSPRSRTEEGQDHDDGVNNNKLGITDDRLQIQGNELENDATEDKLLLGSKSEGIGDYLGIDVRSYSDTEIAKISYANLLDENRRLQDELETLRSLRNKDSLKNVERVERECVVRVLSNESNNDNLDSGFDLPSEEMMEKKIETTRELQARKKEVNKLRKENLEMKEVYESHMKVCGNQKNESISENIRIKSEALGKLQLSVQFGFQQLEDKYTTLESNLTDISSKMNPTSIISKLDRITDFISEDYKTEHTLSIDRSAELDQLKSDLMSNFFSVQDEIHKGHEEIRNRISAATNAIIENMFQAGYKNENVNEGREAASAIRKNGLSYFDEKRSNFYHVSTDNSVSELETIKEKLGGIQHSISESINEKRRAELERHKLQEELVKMVETLKRKDQELGRVSQLYEDEKQKLTENDACFRNEMDELKREQLEIYDEFRNMCETLKRKDIELANRNKQIRLITAERREKEDELNDKIVSLQSEKQQLDGEKSEISKQYQEKYIECKTLIKRFANAEEQLQTIFDNLSKIEGIVLKAKSDGLYK